MTMSCWGVCAIIRDEEKWSKERTRRLTEMNVAFSSELVKMVVRRLRKEPMKVLRFFRWVEEEGVFRNDKETYNAVECFEFAMAGVELTDKRSRSRCTFLLKRIAVAKELDMGLFTRVVMSYRESGKRVTASMFDSVFLCLGSVGRLGECYKVSRVMERDGLVASRGLMSRVAYMLGKAGNEDEANEFINVV